MSGKESLAGDKLALIDAGVEALNTGNVEQLLAIADPEIEFIPMRAPVQGAYHGHDGLREFVADNQESFDVFHITINEAHDLGDRLVLIGTLRIRGKGSGVEVEAPTATLLILREGKIVRFEEFGDRERALSAADPDAAPVSDPGGPDRRRRS